MAIENPRIPVKSYELCTPPTPPTPPLQRGSVNIPAGVLALLTAEVQVRSL